MAEDRVLLTPKNRIIWRTLQTAVWLLGIAIFLALIFWPKIGIHAFWNVLIPVAPALLVFGTGLWRNICPLGSTGLLARHFNKSSRVKLTPARQGQFALIGLGLLLLIVPLRHVVLDTSGPATAIAIACLAIIAVIAGFTVEWKSGWCSGLCPVHQVEKLYGTRPAFTVPNAHCTQCQGCVAICPDSTPAMHPLHTCPTLWHKAVGIIMVGGFAGFIWGWFQVPDYVAAEGWSHLPQAYGMPFAGFAVTLTLFIILKQLFPAARNGTTNGETNSTLVRIFAAAAVSCYYWYRLPALFGFGPYPGDGMLIDMSETLPEWFPNASHIITTIIFFWWLVAREGVARSWTVRPPLAQQKSTGVQLG